MCRGCVRGTPSPSTPSTRVVSVSRAGREHSSAALQNAFTTIGLGMRPGAYAELITLSPGMLVPVPSSSLDAIAVAEPLAVALHGLRRSRFEPGMSVGVVGCGPIGLCAVVAARASGA